MAETDAELLPADDRSFLYGDGVFETTLCVQGRVLWLEMHLDRLMLGARRLGIPEDRRSARKRLEQGARLGSEPAVLRLTLSRGSAPRGYTPPRQPHPRLVLSRSVLSRDPLLPPRAVRVCLSALPLAEQPLLAGIKHCNRLEQVLGAAEARDRGVDDVLMSNARGEVQCSSRANVFLLQGRELITPPGDRCGVAGTRQRLVVESIAPRCALAVRRIPVTPAMIHAADGLLLTNAVMGICGVAEFEGRALPPTPKVTELQKAYRREALEWLAAH
jgi:4-amino-4-deoxychorismate lyase